MDDPVLQPDLNALLTERLRLVALGMGGFFIILTSTHLLLQPKNIALPLVAASALCALVASGVYLYLTQRPLQPRYAHPIAGWMAGMALLNFLLQLYLTRSPTQTVNLLLLIAGFGLI